MPMSARNTVKFKLDPKNTKPPTAAQRKRLTTASRSTIARAQHDAVGAETGLTRLGF